MNTNFRSKNPRPQLTVAMTPMIDVVFLLLIFFVCTTSFQPPEQTLASDVVLSGGAGVDAPTEETPELEEIVLRATTLGGQTRWTVNDADCPSLARLRLMLGALAEIDPTLPVIIDPDGPTPLGQVIAAYDASRSAGFASVRFAASAE